MSVRRIRRLKTGQQIGDLSVIAPIAEIRGRHPIYLCWSHAGWCPVAVKVFRTIQDAEHEHRVMQAAVHPNVLRTFGVAEPALMIMEALEGPSLELQLDRAVDGRLSIGDAIRTTIHIGAALRRLHGAGYAHLDVKPSNVILEAGKPTLIDFGSARAFEARRPSNAHGTTSYMSPEECSRGQVSPASDVFSLGVTAFELLTGRFPFKASTKRCEFPQLAEEPYNLRKFRPRLPVGLDDLILSTLSKDPGARPSLETFLVRLESYIRTGARMWPPEFTP